MAETSDTDYTEEGGAEVDTSVSTEIGRFTIFENQYDFFTSINTLEGYMWMGFKESIFLSSSYSTYSQYYLAMSYIDDETLYNYSWQTDDFSLSLGAGEITIALYYEWDVGENGYTGWKCEDETWTMTSEEYEGTPLCQDSTGNITKEAELSYDGHSLWRYESYGTPSDPSLTVDSEDELLYALSYNTNEAAGLQARFGVGEDNLVSGQRIENFFSSSASELYNTMNVSRFNFKKTDSPEIRTNNLSAIGGVSAVSSDSDSVVTSFASTAIGEY